MRSIFRSLSSQPVPVQGQRSVCPGGDMAEPPGKKLKSSLPQCRAHPSRFAYTSLFKSTRPQTFRCVSLCVRPLFCLLQASAFERDDVALPRVSAFFHQEALKQQTEAEAMLGYLAERGGKYCGKDIQKPGYEAVCAVLPALELLLLQLREEAGALVELSQLAREHGDPHTASVVKSHFLAPRVDRLKLLGDLLTSARRIGCTSDQTRGFGEYILNELQEELTR
ncbi:LOW QUALITY PROTEIN: ferritin light chain, oocyte isoform-like [Pleuronectes platessa]|uniref:LOW QUALITY PROTEIN: ferritin light chain, oocyte isoform-like n=1 Tax=Pleuronectes platessa TaxID=8262 RepID=UPI00232A5FBC|nr:LOW QUALITY PROTEIN: ferritin light chain, oocyte isoform-like [Pleuronectes platessa]